MLLAKSGLKLVGKIEGKKRPDLRPFCKNQTCGTVASLILSILHITISGHHTWFLDLFTYPHLPRILGNKF